jgi:hypothetical protein
MDIETLVLSAVIVFCLLWMLKEKGQLGGAPSDPRTETLSGNAPFASIYDSIGDGVPGSYAGKPNNTERTNPHQLHPTERPLPTYYGHGIPLPHEMLKPGKVWGQHASPHHLNPKCSPKCCPSPYSCDHGCLCVDQRAMRDALK